MSTNELLWYLTRAVAVTGVVLLTAVVVLGTLVAVRRVRSPEVGAVLLRVHRSVSLLAFVFIAAHVVTAVVETYVSIGWISALVPFTAGYRAFWVGLGSVALDLMLAVLITSLLRPWLPPTVFRAVHWATYALWPIALLHGWRAASVDGSWVLVVNAICAAVGVAAVGWRVAIAVREPHRQARKSLPEQSFATEPRVLARTGWRR